MRAPGAPDSAGRPPEQLQTCAGHGGVCGGRAAAVNVPMLLMARAAQALLSPTNYPPPSPGDSNSPKLHPTSPHGARGGASIVRAHPEQNLVGAGGQPPVLPGLTSVNSVRHEPSLSCSPARSLRVTADVSGQGGL